MTRRNRHREAVKFGEATIAQPRAELVSSQSPEAAQELSGLGRWLQIYVEYIHEHGGFDGHRLPKRVGEQIFWHSGTPHDIGSWHAHAGLYLPQIVDGNVFTESRDADLARGVAFGMSDWSLPERNVELAINADGVIKNGRFHEYRSSSTDPETDIHERFTSAEAAAKLGVAAEIAAVLTKFRKAVTTGPAPVMVGVWNHTLEPSAPFEIWAIPPVV